LIPHRANPSDPSAVFQGMHPDAAVTVFLPAGKINPGMPFFPSFLPRKGHYNLRILLQNPQLARNQCAPDGHIVPYGIAAAVNWILEF
jgi:hypothetical protein